MKGSALFLRHLKLRWLPQSLTPALSTILTLSLSMGIAISLRYHTADDMIRSPAWLALPRLPDAHPALADYCSSVEIPLAVAVCAGDMDGVQIGNFIRSTAVTQDQSDDPEEIPDPPSSAHVFRRWHFKSDNIICGLPFLCMGETRNLYAAVLGALYQRHTWKLHHPVVGVTFNKSSTRISFLFFWFEEGEPYCVRFHRV